MRAHLMCMTLAVRKMNMSTATNESPFQYDELFFSKTDLKGIILSGNSVFRRVAEFEWEDLIKKPHNIIRHPDMPRAVFYLLWQFLKNGQPIGAFVKNKSKTGKFYWVFALAMPTEGGYLSVRLKPGGDLLKLIDKEYQALRAVEKSKNLSPEESSQLLLKRIQELGFSNYTEFMTEALVNQLFNRSRERSIEPAAELVCMGQIKNLGEDILKSTNKILHAYKATQLVPLNLDIYANRLGEAGSQISVVADQYKKLADEINVDIKTFETLSKEISQQIATSRFYVCASELLDEVSSYLEKESKEHEIDGLEEVKHLANTYRSKSMTNVSEVISVVRKFISISEGLRSLGTGLELVRVTGKIESARLTNSTEAIALLDNLRQFQVVLSEGLREVLDCNATMDHESKKLLTIMKI